jgi:hypothetical protein
MMSLSALGLLTYLKNNPNVNISARSLEKVLKEGRYAITTAINELKALGILKYKVQNINGNPVGVNTWVLVENQPGVAENQPGWLKTEPLLSLNMLTNTSSKHINILGLYSDGVRMEEGNEMGYKFFSNNSEDEFEKEVKEANQKLKAQKKKEFNAAKKAKQEKAKYNRANKPVKDWSPQDCAYEFARRIEELWNISPISLTESNFIPALAGARVKNDTNGELEVEMMNIFFSSLTDGKYSDGNILWRMFISRFSALAAQAKTRVHSEDEIQKAKEQSAKSWEGIL